MYALPEGVLDLLALVGSDDLLTQPVLVYLSSQGVPNQETLAIALFAGTRLAVQIGFTQTASNIYCITHRRFVPRG
jgi:hypothetical protein